MQIELSKNRSAELDEKSESRGDLLGARLNMPHLVDQIVCGTTGEKKDVEINGPFSYLGRGAYKLVIQGFLNDRRVAIAHALKGESADGMDGFKLLQAAGIPTYEWFFVSADGSFQMMPDLTEKHTIVSTNNPPKGELKLVLRERRREIYEQVLAIVNLSLEAETPIHIYSDSYFLLVNNDYELTVMIGDLEGSETTLHPFNFVRSPLSTKTDHQIRSEILKREAGVFMEMFI